MNEDDKKAGCIVLIAAAAIGLILWAWVAYVLAP